MLTSSPVPFTPLTAGVTVLIALTVLFMAFGPAKVWKKILSVGVVSYVWNGLKGFLSKKS